MNKNTLEAIAHVEARGTVKADDLNQVCEQYKFLVGDVAATKGVSPQVFLKSLEDKKYTADDLKQWIRIALRADLN